MAAAHDERVSLSEWIRRRCDGGLVAGGENVMGEPRVGRAPATVRESGSESSVPPATSSPSRCVRFKLHHVNHAGRPCEVCGYPNSQEAK